ncbi:MAG: amidohydrolase family protein [Nitrososphaerota archaeon]
MTAISLQGCNIVNLDNGEVLSDTTVFIEKNIIARLQDKRLNLGRVIDLEGAYLIPGIINVHNNLSIPFPFEEVNPNEPETFTAFRCYTRALKAVKAGVTTLRTVGEIHRVDIYLRDLINKGLIEGPTIFASGKGLGATGGHGAGFGMVETDGPDQFLKMARRELKLGADHLKIFITGGIAKSEEDLTLPQMTQEEVSATVKAAHSYRTYVTAHCGGSEALIEAVEAGVKCFEHGYILNKDAVKSLRENACYLVPTLSVTRSPEWMRNNGFDETIIEKALSIKDKHSQSFLKAFNEGVTIVCGTDLPPGDLNDGVNATVREIEFMVELGMSPLEALRAATVNAAKLCAADHYLGRIDVGFQASIIALRENPLKDIKTLEQPQLIICKGRMIENDRYREIL